MSPGFVHRNCGCWHTWWTVVSEQSPVIGLNAKFPPHLMLTAIKLGKDMKHMWYIWQLCGSGLDIGNKNLTSNRIKHGIKQSNYPATHNTPSLEHGKFPPAPPPGPPPPPPPLPGLHGPRFLEHDCSCAWQKSPCSESHTWIGIVAHSFCLLGKKHVELKLQSFDSVNWKCLPVYTSSERLAIRHAHVAWRLSCTTRIHISRCDLICWRSWIDYTSPEVGVIRRRDYQRRLTRLTFNLRIIMASMVTS